MYNSQYLVNAKIRYLPLEKLVLALVHATRKLPYYFQTYTVYVLTEYPLQSLLKWGTQLGSFHIRYRPKSSMKGQVLVDFVVEFSLRRQVEIVCHVEVQPWRVFVDGVSRHWGLG